MIILDDKDCRGSLFPFALIRYAAEIRIGIITIREKWELLTGEKISLNNDEEGIRIPANIIPTQNNYRQIIEAAEKNEPISEDAKRINHSQQIFQLNDYALREDFKLITKDRKSAPISQTNQLINPENIFIEEGAVMEYSIINASAGPVYIGKNAVVMEGNLIRGPFSLGENSILKMGSKIYGATTIGPNCVGGGEIKNSVMFANSNKAHDGYLGDSVLGEWCNLGAGTSNSNVKNTGGDVGYFSAKNEKTSAGNKAGLLMGDYSRCAINTSFNTGTVVGICCNIFGEKMPAKFTGNFTWGEERYDFEKAVQHIANWKKMKGKEFSPDEISILKNIYNSE